MARTKVEDRPNTLNRSERPKRVPINGFRDVLAVGGQEPGWHYCWVNEDEVPRYENGGYDFVEHDVTIGDRKVNAASQMGGRISTAVGNGVTGFLMRCPDEVYQEELDLVHGRVDESERAMYQNLNSGTDGRYGSVKIERPKR
jgi:hypothetical protein